MVDLVITDIEADVIARIAKKAELNGRSVDQELRAILTAAAPLTTDQKLALIDRAHALTKGRAQTSRAEDWVREDRDSR